jgi:hypothetical protein
MEITNGERKIEDMIHVLEEEVASLSAQREDISTRISSMSQIVVRLKHLCGTRTHRPSLGRGYRLGVTRACRLVLMESRERPLTIHEVFRAIQAKLAPETLAHKDPRASVATILGRLVEYGEAEAITDSNGKRVYKWIDQNCVTRQSYELVLPSLSPIDQSAGPSKGLPLNSGEKP